jgi:zinc/manganese transport system permease protein
MTGFWEMMIAPIVMALVLVAMHSHLGFHVVKRGVIFVDIALAQMAALGVAIALLFGGEVGTDRTWIVALASTFAGAVLIAGTRSKLERVPQEAYIGIIYAVSSAGMILVLTGVPHGGDEIRHLLVGALLWVTWPMVIKTAILYGILGVLLFRWRKPLSRVSRDPEAARADGLSLMKWDFAFYLILGIVVTSSVQVAGVLLVFSLLVVPAVMGARLFDGGRRQFLYSLTMGVGAVIVGSGLSYLADFPTGAAIVCTFGVFLGLQILGGVLIRRR